MTAFTISLEPIIHLTHDQFYQLCQANPDIKFERNASGDLIIMPPTGGATGNYNSELNAELVLWNRQTRLGKVFDSSTCFHLPNGADRSPDLAWVAIERWNALTPEQQRGFPPIAPDFVLELLSPTDRLQQAQAKMREYRDNGVRLGWLLDRDRPYVEIYRLGQSVEMVQNPEFLAGESVLPGFTLNMQILK
jgi:Uma2 family endonuclease